MCKLDKKRGMRRIDPCMVHLVEFINKHTKYKTVSCCCGHGKYPPTLIVRSEGSMSRREIFSDMVTTRKRRFYKRDKQGYYYIPEIIGEK